MLCWTTGMSHELTLGLAFAAGLGGAGHCWAMCGSLAGGLFFGCAQRAGAVSHAAYHLGRVSGYSVLGALTAGLGQALVLTGGVGQGQAGLYLLAGWAVVTVGVWQLLFPVGRLGSAGAEAACAGRRDRSGRPVAGPGKQGRRLAWLACLGRQDGPQEGIGKAAQAVQRSRAAPFLLAGLLNALMPCAMVYSLAIKATTAASLLQGASWLLAFGLGTLPAMAVAGAAAHWLGSRALSGLRRVAAVCLIGLGAQAVVSGAGFFRVMARL